MGAVAGPVSWLGSESRWDHTLGTGCKLIWLNQSTGLMGNLGLACMYYSLRCSTGQPHKSPVDIALCLGYILSQHRIVYMRMIPYQGMSQLDILHILFGQDYRMIQHHKLHKFFQSVMGKCLRGKLDKFGSADSGTHLGIPLIDIC